MANDTDLWNDIEELTGIEGETEEVRDLIELYRLRYVDYDGSEGSEARLNEFKEQFHGRHGYLPNV